MNYSHFKEGKKEDVSKMEKQKNERKENNSCKIMKRRK